MPFGPYDDFAQCVSKNQDKDNPEAYCATIHKKTTGDWPAEYAPTDRDVLKELHDRVVVPVKEPNRDEVFVGVEIQDCDGNIRHENIPKSTYEAYKQTVSDNGGIILKATDEKGQLMEQYRRPVQKQLDALKEKLTKR